MKRKKEKSLEELNKALRRSERMSNAASVIAVIVIILNLVACLWGN